MRNDRVLLVLVVADFFLVILTVVADIAFRFTLPAALAEHGGKLSLGDVIRLPFWAAIVLVTLVSWIGLLNYWAPARFLYAGAWAAWLLLVATAGPSVMTGAGAAIETLEHLVGGAIIGLVYCSDLRHRFTDADTEAAPLPAVR